MKKANVVQLKNVFLIALLSSIFIFPSSCSDDNDDVPAPQHTLDSVFVDTLDVGYVKPIGGRDFEMDTTNHYVLFDLNTGEVIPTEDSVSTKWDIGFYGPYVFVGKDMILNSGIHGPGSVKAQIVNKPFNEVLTAPSEGYEMDNQNSNVFSNIPNYQPDTHLIIPNDSVTYLIRTNEGNFVKFKLINLYKGKPSESELDFKSSILGFYSFKYVIQRNGTQNFTEK